MGGTIHIKFSLKGVITARIRSLREGNVFTLSVYPQGGGLVRWQVRCQVRCQVWWGGAWSGGRSSVRSGAKSIGGGVPSPKSWGAGGSLVPGLGGRVPSPRSRGGGYPNMWGKKLGIFFILQFFFLLDADHRCGGHGQYASCGHAGGLSCFNNYI